MRVSGNPTPEETAVLAALLGTRRGEPEPDAFARWRATRLAAVRRMPRENRSAR